jgi:hypothetical protein
VKEAVIGRTASFDHRRLLDAGYAVVMSRIMEVSIMGSASKWPASRLVGRPHDLLIMGVLFTATAGSALKVSVKDRAGEVEHGAHAWREASLYAPAQCGIELQSGVAERARAASRAGHGSRRPPALSRARPATQPRHRGAAGGPRKVGL